MADYDVAKAFEEIEDELISSMIRNLKRHKAKETSEGIQWTQWQALQLKALEDYKAQNQKVFGRRFSTINQNIQSAIQNAYVQGGADQEIEILKAISNGFKNYHYTGNTETTGEFFRTNSNKMDALIKATTNDMEKAETAVLRMANDQYRKIIFNAQVYANSGAGTYKQAVDMATRDFLSAGINCIQYKNGRRVNIKSYAEMAIRTANKRAYLTGEGEKRMEWGISTVIVQPRGNPCPLCLPFVGKVLIDDVWSGGKPDGKHKLMSEAIAAGLYHPNCKDIHTTYFDELSDDEVKDADEQDRDNAVEDYNNTQKRNYAENQAEKYDRLSKHSLDESDQKKYEQKAAEWHARAENIPSSKITQEEQKTPEISDNESQRLMQLKEKIVEEPDSVMNFVKGIANPANDDIMENIKQLSLENLGEFEKWEEDYYKTNQNVSFTRQANPAIFQYSGGDYDVINALERGGQQLERVKKCYGEKYVESLKGLGDKISNELSKFKLNTPLKLKRSVGNVDYITGTTSSIEDMKKMIGKTFTEKGFTSTTVCSDTQLPFGGFNNPTKTTLEIIAPKETKGAYIYKISESPAEFEFLIDKNTTYQIIDAGEREISVKDYKGNIIKKTERYMILKVIEQ